MLSQRRNTKRSNSSTQIRPAGNSPVTLSCECGKKITGEVKSAGKAMVCHIYYGHMKRDQQYVQHLSSKLSRWLDAIDLHRLKIKTFSLNAYLSNYVNHKYGLGYHICNSCGCWLKSKQSLGEHNKKHCKYKQQSNLDQPQLESNGSSHVSTLHPASQSCYQLVCQSAQPWTANTSISQAMPMSSMPHLDPNILSFIGGTSNGIPSPTPLNNTIQDYSNYNMLAMSGSMLPSGPIITPGPSNSGHIQSIFPSMAGSADNTSAIQLNGMATTTFNTHPDSPETDMTDKIIWDPQLQAMLFEMFMSPNSGTNNLSDTSNPGSQSSNQYGINSSDVPDINTNLPSY